MTSALSQDPPQLASASAAEAGGSSTAFWLHVVAFFLFYLTVVIAWGERNAWPTELLLCVLSLPLSTLVVSSIFKAQGIGFGIEPAKSQQEQLIAALVLAVGLASGQVLLMSLGLVCLGGAWLRPARPDVDWTEWLKIPLVYLTALPFWLDFAGNRNRVAALLDDPMANPVFELPLGLSTTQAQLLGYCGLLSMVLFLRGRAFWLALPLLPAFLVLVSSMSRVIPGWTALDPMVRQAMPWIIGVLAMVGAVRLAGGMESASRWVVSGETLRNWFEGRRYPPWIAVLVVAIMQALPFETVRIVATDWVGIAGVGVMGLLLLGLRLRTPKGPIHSRSVAMVAGGLALTLVAEFSTNEQLRHVASALVLIGLVSWHCFWPLRVFVTAAVASVLLLISPAPESIGLVDASWFGPARLGVGFGCVVLLAWFIQQPPPLGGSRGYSDEGWIPPKRFAFIMLGLMMLFQTGSAFWPEHDMALPDLLPMTQAEAEAADLIAPGEPGWFRVLSAKGAAQVAVAYPRKIPYLLESPERTLVRRGWRVVDRLRVAHPRGEATCLRLERDGSKATALWWFESGDRAFANHLYARRVLWSGWHLADRRLRLVRLESTMIPDPKELVAMAESANWFPRGRMPSGKR